MVVVVDLSNDSSCLEPYPRLSRDQAKITKTKMKIPMPAKAATGCLSSV